tara:strand:+ start:931 stop:1401 length:471 start_codon:yes stop_codon:yes gene_type:complete
VLKFLSVNNIVIAPASTGSDNSKRIAVINTAHTKSGILCIVIPGVRMFKIVVIKFMAPKIEEIPARCKLKIAKSIDPPEWNSIEDNGGYTVHPVPAPPSTRDDDINKIKAGGKSQKDILFNLGNAISGAPIISGTNQFPNPPIITGITKKKIITKA